MYSTWVQRNLIFHMFNFITYNLNIKRRLLLLNICGILFTYLTCLGQAFLKVNLAL